MVGGSESDHPGAPFCISVFVAFLCSVHAVSVHHVSL